MANTKEVRTTEELNRLIEWEEHSIEWHTKNMMDAGEAVARQTAKGNVKEMERKAKEIVAEGKKVAKAKKELKELKAELKKAEAQEMKKDDSLQAVKDFLEMIYEDDIKYHARMKDMFRNEFKSNTVKAINEGKMTKTAVLIAKMSNKEAEELFRRDLEMRYKKIEEKVKEKAGNEIKEVNLVRNPNDGLDGVIIGNKGTINFSTILAGGYNIQRLHYRTLIN